MPHELYLCLNNKQKITNKCLGSSHTLFFSQSLLIMASGGGGVLTLTWYTYMCLPFGALFRKIWYSDRGGGGVSSETKEPKLHNWVYFGQIIVKSTQFDQNWVLFFQKWYTDGWEIWQKIGIEIVRFSRSGRHIHVRFWWKNPPPPPAWHCTNCVKFIWKKKQKYMMTEARTKDKE